MSCLSHMSSIRPLSFCFSTASTVILLFFLCHIFLFDLVLVGQKEGIYSTRGVGVDLNGTWNHAGI